MNYSIEKDLLTIFLNGRIDSVNSESTLADINKIISDNSFKNLVFDAENLIYISSAGLRVILKIKKNFKSLKIINVSSEVYEIFDMTGFTEMLEIEKAYRKLSVDNCEIIGRGACGTVYRLDCDTVIKVFKSTYSLENIISERELARKAFIMGVPTAIPYDVVKVGNSFGSVFELLNAKSFAELIIEAPEKKDEILKLYVDTLKTVNAVDARDKGLPSAKENVLKILPTIKNCFSDSQYKKLYELINFVPESFNMIHGDFHIKNLMMQNSEPVIIDMDTLSVGNPIFELAAIFIAYCCYSENDHDNTMEFYGMPYESAIDIWNNTLKLYFDNRLDELESITEKIKLVGYTYFLYYMVTDDEPNDLNIKTSINHISELLEKLTTLNF